MQVARHLFISRILLPSRTLSSLRRAPLKMADEEAVDGQKLFDLKGSVPFKSLVRTGAELLKAGKIIAIPTDTLYGLAADASRDDAIALLYDIKGRNCEKPIAICVSDIDDVEKWAEVTVSRHLLQDFLPGPVTLVFRRRSTLNPNLNPKTHLIGIRIPDYDFVRELARENGGPFALTSANPSAAPSTISPEEFKGLWPRLAGVFDGGRVGAVHPGSSDLERSGSTVIDLSLKGSFQIIRPGVLHQQAIQVLQDKHGLKQIT